MTDWGAGRYETTATQLAPAAARAVAVLAPRPGERVLDVACGTGNAALLAAAAGAEVVGVDSAARLLDVARARAAADGLDAAFELGDAAALPAADAAFDATVSVFGVIFAPPEQGARELLRVTRPGGRVVLTTWTTEGPTPKAMAVVREALGAPSPPPAWSDPAVVERLFAGHAVQVMDAALRFTATSPEAYVAEYTRDHPMWLAAAPALRAAGKLDAVLAAITAIYAEASEDPRGFALNVPYRVTSIRVGG